ncbi:MAG: hypothetical protein ACFFBD_26160, partial [Candidatus Hodarchaeota archaeon]
SKVTGYLVSPRGVILISIPYVLVAFIGLIPTGLMFYIINNIGALPTLIVIVVVGCFLPGLLLTLFGSWSLAVLVLGCFQKIKITLRQDSMEIELKPTIRQEKPRSYLYEQIEKIEPRTKQFGRVPIILSNYFLDNVLMLCRTEDEAEMLSSFITSEIQRLASTKIYLDKGETKVKLG